MKIKNIYSKLTAVGLLTGALFLTSCQDDIVYGSKEKAIITMPETSFSVVEGQSAQVTFTADKAVTKDMLIRIEAVSGTATEGVDFPTPLEALDPLFPQPPASGSYYTIPAGSTSVTVDIETTVDVAFEGEETIVFRAFALGSLAGIIDTTFEVTISDFQSDNLGLELGWSLEDNSEGLSACDLDMDIFTDDFSAYTFTSDCREVLTQTTNPSIQATGVLADGEYFVYADLWAASGADAITPELNIPIEVVVGKVGKFSVTINYENLYTTSHPESDSGATQSEGNELVARIVVSGGNYTVYDRDNNLVGQE